MISKRLEYQENLAKNTENDLVIVKKSFEEKSRQLKELDKFIRDFIDEDTTISGSRK